MGTRTSVTYRCIKYDENGRRTGGFGTATILNGDYDHFEIKDMLEAKHPGYVIEINTVKKI